MRILVVEDEVLIRMIIVETLEEDGFETLEAATGNEALRLIDDPDDVGLLVTDLHLPGPSGVAVAQHIRALHPSVPVLFISARPDLLKSLEAPIPYRSLTKPFTMEQLSIAVEELLGASDQHAH